MKIKKLSIKNIASIESAELDFENGALGEAPLFLICGETGSGKTTILDSITLALYGKTPRYDGSGVKNPQEIGGYAYNDARQLVRRGATSASAMLSLIGNNGKPYEAEWSVEAISRGQNKGMLKNEKWTWKDCSPGGVNWTKVSDCKAVALRAVGLEFEQFCRTTILAQGQFTKFLMGTPDEKAEILEKLTDTSKYSELGKAIAAKGSSLEEGVKTLEDEISRMTGLGEAREEVERRIAELKSKIEELGRRRESADSRLRWLQRRKELVASAETAKRNLAEAFSALRAQGKAKAAEVDGKSSEVELIRKYLAEKSAESKMLESSEVILSNLQDVRAARNNRAQAEKELERSAQTVPELARRLEEATQKFECAGKEVSAAEGELNFAEQALESMEREKVQKEKNAAEKLRGDLLGLEGQINGLAPRKESVAGRERQNAERREKLAAKESELPALKSAMEAAVESADREKKVRDEQKQLIAAGIEKVVAELNVGDTCPICGNRIEKLNGSDHFQALFQSLEAKCREADDAAKKKEREYNAARADIDGLKDAIESESKQLSKDKEQIARDEREMAEKAKFYKLGGSNAESVHAAIVNCDAKIAELDRRLSAAYEQDNKVKECRKALKKSGHKRDECKDARNIAEKALAEMKSQMTQHENAVKAEARREKEKLEEVSGRVTEPGWLEAWEKDPASVESAFSNSAREYAARKAELPKVENARDALLAELGQIRSCVSRVAEKVPSLEETCADGMVATTTGQVEGLLGRYEEVRSGMEAHLANRPEGLAGEDTCEALAKEVDEIKATETAVVTERGKCQEQLAADDRCAEARAEKSRELEKLRAECDEWRPIHAYFGDNDGKKIRREIQSYVLANVLVKANHYLRQLTSRYELSCEGLTLSVKDSFDGGAERPVNTLSGGEQFLVSLALALGLAGAGESGLGADMLLIDEGFGTLSGEHLNSAIEALERLNAITGSRKVGVISHVERLRERIRTHIEVTRNGQSPSMVRVVDKRYLDERASSTSRSFA